MKRILIIFLSVFISLCVYSQKVIPMEKQNGVYRISCSVNGAKMKMIFDTGASAVSLSETMANFLYDNGYITKEDILGTSKSRTADGTIHDNVVINIKDIEISGLHIKNVQAVVLSSQNAPLLLGQSAIQKLGHISLNGNKLIINDYEGDYSEEEIFRIMDLAIKYNTEGNHNASISNWLKIIDYVDLGTTEYWYIIDSFFMTSQYNNVVKYTKEWERKCRDEEPNPLFTDIYQHCGDVLSLKLNKPNDALVYYEKALELEEKDELETGMTLSSIANAYYELDEFDKAIMYYKKATTSYFKQFNISEEEIKTKGIENPEMGICLHGYALVLIYGKKDINYGNYIMSLAARCNNEISIEYCNEHDIKYYRIQSLLE